MKSVTSGRARLSVGPITDSAAFTARLKVGPFPVATSRSDFDESFGEDENERL
jgi:hypothetical protein